MSPIAETGMPYRGGRRGRPALEGWALPTGLVGALLLPAHERLRGRETLRHLAGLRRLEGDPRALRRLHADKLAALLRHCARHVPFYRAHLRGAEPSLEAFPVLEREAVREHGRALLAEGFRGSVLPSSTGGSTGRPLQLWTDKAKEARHNAQKLRFRQWFGVRPGDRQVDFWGSPIELGKASWVRTLKDRYLLNQALLSAHDLTEARIDAYARALGRFRPRLVYGYPTVIYRVARHAAAHPERLGGWRPQAVFCTAEMLYPQLREGIARGLDCPVANEYGARDGGLIAHECPEGRLHVASEHVHVEVAEPDEEGVGDLLITNLDGYAMPLVRYRVGDRGRLGREACPCGASLPVLERLEGRRNDFLLGADRRRVHGSAANYVLRERPEVIQYRLVQRADLSLDLQVVATGDWGEPQERAVAAGLRRVLGGELPVRIERVAAIPPSPSGKYRWVESEASAP
nr:phenylacetate--CoA ligase family protein [Halorhodospira neutriphila]